MSHHQQNRQFQMASSVNNETAFTKIFVGGLAWETKRETMRRYFDQFGDILEAVVITDKHTGRSKGYGFVTFRDPESAMRACQNPSPVIDGRRANCNLASLGAHKPRPPTPQHHGSGSRFRAGPGLMAPSAYQSTASTYFPQPPAQYPLPYSAYGYSGYSQDTMYPMNYYGVYGGGGGQQFLPYLGTAGGAGMYHNFYPYYAQYTTQQSSTSSSSSSSQVHHHHSQNHGFNVQLVPQYPYLPQHYGSSGLLSLPPTSSSMPMTSTITTSTTSTVTPAAATDVGVMGGTGTVVSSEQNSST